MSPFYCLHLTNDQRLSPRAAREWPVAFTAWRSKQRSDRPGLHASTRDPTALGCNLSSESRNSTMSPLEHSYPRLMVAACPWCSCKMKRQRSLYCSIWAREQSVEPSVHDDRLHARIVLLEYAPDGITQELTVVEILDDYTDQRRVFRFRFAVHLMCSLPVYSCLARLMWNT